VRHLFGLNAQTASVPYLALWARLHEFEIGELTAAIERGAVVRSVTVRGTQHVLTAADFDLVRPVVAPLLRRLQRSTFGRRVGDVDLDGLVAEARELLADGAV